MKVKVIRSFGSTQYGHYSEGQVIDLPDGVDWLKAGLVVPFKEPLETATAEPPEKATKPRVTRRRAPKAKQRKAEE